MSNKIVVRLPRRCSGQEILDGFRAAATFQESSTVKWEARRYFSPSGTASVENTFFPTCGYYATPAYLREQGRISRLFRGKRSPKWETVSGGDVSRFETQIFLHALHPEGNYVTINLTVTRLEWADPMREGCIVIHDPDAKEFAPYRAAYDRIIREFLRRVT